MAKSGASDAVISAVARAEARSAGADPVQTELLPPTRFHPVDQADRHTKVVEHVRRDRAGRPPGAKNKTTRQMLDFIRDQLGDPLLESARLAMHTPASLSEELSCTLLEAATLLEKVRSDLRPYFYAKQAPVDGDGKPVPGLTVEFHGHGAQRAGPSGERLPPWLYDEGVRTIDAKPQQNQQLAETPSSVSHDSVSHDGEK